MKELPESTQEKSDLLANIMGWEMKVDGPYPLGMNTSPPGTSFSRLMAANKWLGYEIKFRSLSGYPTLPDLYETRNMALAWRVLNWATETKLIIFDSWWMGFISAGIMMPPDAFIDSLLDKILELAIEDGLIEMEIKK